MQAQTHREAGPTGPTRLVWQVLSDAMASASAISAEGTAAAGGGVSATVLDCGGGSGTFAVPLARSGAQVTVVDVSADALATLARRAVEAGVADRVSGVQGDVEALTAVVPGAQFDLVLAHGILEAVDHLEPAFAAIAAAVRPGGRLSVLVGNPVAAVLSRAMAGDLSAALQELRGLDSDPHHPGPDAVRALCAGAGLVVETVHGVGVFSDLIPGAWLDAPGALETLADLESESATRRPFADIATRVHVLANRPG